MNSGLDRKLSCLCGKINSSGNYITRSSNPKSFNPKSFERAMSSQRQNNQDSVVSTV
jgi:hypothetical protein